MPSYSFIKLCFTEINMTKAYMYNILNSHTNWRRNTDFVNKIDYVFFVIM